MHKHVSNLTSSNGKTYNTADEWIADHGPSSTDHELVKGWKIECDGSATVKRTLVFLNEEDEAVVLVEKGTAKSFVPANADPNAKK